MLSGAQRVMTMMMQILVAINRLAVAINILLEMLLYVLFGFPKRTADLEMFVMVAHGSYTWSHAPEPPIRKQLSYLTLIGNYPQCTFFHSLSFSGCFS